MAGPNEERSDPEVTVVVPTRNRAGYLSDCLAALAAQRSSHPFEVLVVDNGSTDDTPEVIDRWCREDPRFRTTREPSPSLSKAKNAGVRSARGSLLLFTDDDAIAEEGWIQAYVELFAAEGAALILSGGPVVPSPHDLGPWPGWFEQGHLADLGLLDYGARRLLVPGEYVWGGNMAIPAAVFQRLGVWDESVGRRGEERGTFEDAEYQDRLRAAGGVVWFCPQAVVRHRLPRSEITPRSVVGTAFARGRNEHARQALDRRGIPITPTGPASTGEPDPLAEGLAALGANLWGWMWWTARLRASSGKAALERARRAAWRSGWSLDEVQYGRGTSAASRLAGRLAVAVRSLALRLTPGPR